RVDAAEVVRAVGKPRIDHIGRADVLQPDAAIRLPRLLERLPDPLRRSAVPPIHRPPLDDAVLGASSGDLLDVPLRRVARMPIVPPGKKTVIASREGEREEPGGGGLHVGCSGVVKSGKPKAESGKRRERGDRSLTRPVYRRVPRRTIR